MTGCRAPTTMPRPARQTYTEFIANNDPDLLLPGLSLRIVMAFKITEVPYISEVRRQLNSNAAVPSEISSRQPNQGTKTTKN